MSNALKKNALALAIVAGLGMSGAAFANETTSSINGRVLTPTGQPAAGTEVIIIHIPSGTTKVATVNDAGIFTAKGLRVGGPYKVILDSNEYQDADVDDIFLSLGRAYDLSVELENASNSAIETITVTGDISRAVAYSENGPSANFNLEQLQDFPAINRNISDIVRMDPRISVDESRGDINAIQCAGKSPRFNSLTLDGVRMNDSFGLNANGYPTERMPFSYDAIEQVAVELAPFDVTYGGFTACNINAVTKSGANEVYGGMFIDYTNNNMRGDSLEGDKVNIGDYNETRYGVNVGLPIIEDKVFLFAAYEKQQGTNLFNRGPIGSGAVEEIGLSQAALDEIAEIAKTKYQYDPGGIPTSLDNEDEKLLIKLDWNINDAHRFAFTYNYNDGNNFTESDGDLDEFEFENHLYERGAELNSYSGALYSDWTDSFSTEMRVGYLKLDNRQNSVGGTDFGEMRVKVDGVNVYLGGDDSRQANDLNYDLFNLSLRGYYYMDNGHNLTFGYERDTLDVFNLFVQHTETEIRFNSIEDFRDGYASAIYYNNAPSGNPNDAAADWGYSANSVYFQDAFYPTDNLRVVAGLRYDWYETSDSPIENPEFVESYGFSNSTNLDGEGLLQPRLGLTYELDTDTVIRGGVGLFTGGNPNVWLSNNFSNNNVLQFGQRGKDFGYTDGSRSLFDSDVVYLGLEDGVPNGPGYGVPSELYNAVAAGDGRNFELNYLDPNFKLPSEWKISTGVTHIFPQDYVLNADLLVSISKDAAIVKRADLEQTGTTDEGYPIYESTKLGAFVLTNTNETSTSYTASLGISKSHENGISWMAGYAYNDAEDVQPMTSSVAFSNYVNRAFFDPQEEVVSRSNYNVRHRFTANFNWSKELIAGYETTVSLFGLLTEGEPYSLTLSADDSFGIYKFSPFLDETNNVLPVGGVRNSEIGSWWGKVDMQVTQQMPAFSAEHKSEAFIVIDNLTNLLNDDWGILEKANFPGNVTIGEKAEGRIGDASLWEIRVGLRYEF
ncbi:TonB-dependent receptor [Shewanella submarina]|uniref:TonB-dependent receptor domain-containing protein n=1 Tax=Shewanella submarina TaxID=2016376 RepID=A0ABV7G9A8_9GAMM|nr:TonB-dependent receptor [Shewanella submarina]MCL1039272.1 TonB-dependent receptor [Shewanella submarina]